MISLCPECKKRIEAEKIIKDNKVFIHKTCEEHGFFECLLEDNAEYYEKRYDYDKPGTKSKTQTVVKKSCPYDCGICTEHKQHTCIALIEITNSCNLQCPTCYAKSGEGSFLSIEKIEEMVDFIINVEGGQAEIIQLSGGEPTMHPDIIDIIKMIKRKNVNYVMINTNGIRIKKKKKFVAELEQFRSGFEIYLQFDGLDKDVYTEMRNKDLLQIKLDAIKNLSEKKIPITLVSTIDKNINESQIGRIFEFAINSPFIRGINYQPVAFFGRNDNVDALKRSTLTGILEQLDKQTAGMIGTKDFIPLPCDVERVAIAYLYKEKNGFSSITRKVDLRKYLGIIKNTFNFNANEIIKDALKNPSVFGCNCLDFLKDIRPLIPKGFVKKNKNEKTEHINDNVFRVSVTSFIDAYNFDIKSAQKECVHVITPDLKRIPFSMYNLIYRDKYENN